MGVDALLRLQEQLLTCKDKEMQEVLQEERLQQQEPSIIGSFNQVGLGNLGVHRLSNERCIKRLLLLRCSCLKFCFVVTKCKRGAS